MTYLLCLLLALPFWHHKAPEVFCVKFETTAGSFVIEAHRDWSPHGADRFYELVRTKYYDDSRFFRVVPGRWVQFGINGNPTIAQQQRRITIPDDPLKQHNTAGYVAFSNTGPDTRSTQVYINSAITPPATTSKPASKAWMSSKNCTAVTENTPEAECEPATRTRCSKAATPGSIANIPNSTNSSARPK
jgi:cyclophilin family peptidyl-prolyl cis-trans isomerase